MYYVACASASGAQSVQQVADVEPHLMQVCDVCCHRTGLSAWQIKAQQSRMLVGLRSRMCRSNPQQCESRTCVAWVPRAIAAEFESIHAEDFLLRPSETCRACKACAQPPRRLGPTSTPRTTCCLASRRTSPLRSARLSSARSPTLLRSCQRCSDSAYGCMRQQGQRDRSLPICGISMLSGCMVAATTIASVFSSVSTSACCLNYALQRSVLCVQRT